MDYDLLYLLETSAPKGLQSTDSQRGEPWYMFEWVFCCPDLVDNGRDQWRLVGEQLDNDVHTLSNLCCRT